MDTGALFTTNQGFVGSTPVAAIGTITVTNFNNDVGDVITINGKTLTEGVEWTTQTSNNVTASNIATAINTATATTECRAIAVGAVVNITANTPGAAGNSLTTAISDGAGLAVSGAHLTGGAD